MGSAHSLPSDSLTALCAGPRKEEEDDSPPLGRANLPRTSSVLISPAKGVLFGVGPTLNGTGADSTDSLSLLIPESPPARGRMSELGSGGGGSGGHSSLGILVHGCHLQADEWESLVWGVPPHQLGRLPHAALLAWEERRNLACVSIGTGASASADGELEGAYMLRVLMERVPRLSEFRAFRDVPLSRLASLLGRVASAETRSQNTTEEVREGFRIFAAAGCRRAVLVSSPTHLPRCLGESASHILTEASTLDVDPTEPCVCLSACVPLSQRARVRSRRRSPASSPARSGRHHATRATRTRAPPTLWSSSRRTAATATRISTRGPSTSLSSGRTKSRRGSACSSCRDSTRC